MRLKSLEIKGFKSFADKTILNFDEGITGVIGPNGCGKSNIIDSIRWVIGEHKISNLRSENLESLIFNGSKSRNASGLAEVSLTFENTKKLLPTEFSTVTITRKYFKSGESEYRLNDVACRLKDIHNLFMDTGVSTDSYAIIELGMVDDIIKDKENSRRRMLEQAAGITIYKTRKKEAKLKLDATQQDLARIEDLLFEINNQLKTLENQAKKAEKYFEIKKDYREVSIELAKASLHGFNLTYKDLNDKQKEETDKKIELEADIAKHEAIVEEEKVSFIEKEKALQQLQQSFNILLDSVRKKENEKNLSSQKLQHLEERKAGLYEFINKSDEQLKALKESIEFTSQQVKEEELKTSGLDEKLKSLKLILEEKRKTYDEKRQSVDVLRRENANVQRNQFDAEKKIAVADTSIQNLQRSIQHLEEEKNQRSLQLENLEKEKISKSEELKEKQELLLKIQQEHDLTKQQILKTQHELEVLRNNFADESRKLDSKKNEHALIKSMVDSMEGYPESVKFLHKNLNWNHKSPVLSDIIYVKEEYRAAVENVLEPYLNYYVVENIAEGLKAVHLLDENKKGKANFFLLDKFHDTTSYETPDGTIPALDVIETDSQYKSLASHLLGNVFIAENESAIEKSGNAIILEKSGKFVKRKYSITGGSVGIFEGKKIGRAKNMEKLQKEISSLDAVVNDIKKNIQDKHNEVLMYNNSLKEDLIKKTQQEINHLNNQAFAVDNRIESLQNQNLSSEKRLSELHNQLSASKDAIEKTRIDLGNINSAVAELTEKVQIVEIEYSNAEQEYNRSSLDYNDSNLQFTRQQSRVASLKQELNFKTNQINDLVAQIERSTQQYEEAITNISSLSETLSDLQESLLKELHTKQTEEKRLNESDQEYYNLRNALNAKENDLRQKHKNKEITDQILTEIKDKLNDLKLQLAGMKERLSVEFRVHLEEIMDEPRTSETSVDELRERSDKLKKRLENIGEVNPTAIEAFTEMKKRYEFILEQKTDLVTAKDSLMQTIQEVEATANQQFLDTFNKTRENFQKVFKALFTEEDTADMILVDPDNLAETGIDIIAKPKGKRPSSIGQLSGGEKTLTATALLFAIYLIKPAPFCILDEVDAPLDDANVGKFTNMIKQFSENSQFIIVTHNKQTMSAVDVIYGVTMQEAGVSKLVPVDFRNLN